MFGRNSKKPAPENRDKAAVSNWSIGADGSLEPTPGSCRYIPGNDGTYELDYIESSLSLGILLETNSVGNYAIVKGLTADCSEIARKVVSIGDVLVSVNKHQMLKEDFSDVITFLEMLREGGLARRMRFLNPTRCPVAVYAERLLTEEKSHKDMFGFVRSIEYLQKERQYKATRVQIDAQRDMDWVQYLKSIGGPDNVKPSGMFRPSPELKALVRRGIPVAYRALLWPKLSLANKYKLKYPTNYYQELLNRQDELASKVEIDIDKDIDRTFPEHDYYGCGGGGEVLRRVLVAHALHNPTIGYCQSLNFVAGMMLLFMQEEDAFWLFITVVDTLLPHDYYSSTMVGTYIDQFVFAHIIQTRLEKVHAVLEGAALQIPLVTVQWFMCVYVNAVPPETALRIWDMFLNEGPKVLFRVAVALFKLHEKQLLQAKDAGEVYNILKGMGKNVIDADLLIAAGYRNYVPPRRPKNVLYASAQKSGTMMHLAPERPVFRPQTSVKELGSPKTRKATYSTYAGWIAAQVPSVLTGIGLGHLGPKVTSDDNDESSGASDDATPESAVAALSRNIFEIRDQVLEDYCSVAGVEEQERSITTTPVTSSPLPLSSRVKKSMRLSKVRDYRSFSRLDLEKWRAQFRPEVEERFRTMETAREQWREKDKETKKDRESIPASSVAKLNAGNLDARRNLDDSPEVRNNINSDPECDGDEDDDDDESGAQIDLCFYHERPSAHLPSSSTKPRSASSSSIKPPPHKGPVLPEQSPAGYSLNDESEGEIWPDGENGHVSSMMSPSVWTGENHHTYSSEEEEMAYETEEIDKAAVAYRNPRMGIASSSGANSSNSPAAKRFSSPGYTTNTRKDVSDDDIDLSAPFNPSYLPEHLQEPIHYHTEPHVKGKSKRNGPGSGFGRGSGRGAGRGLGTGVAKHGASELDPRMSSLTEPVVTLSRGKSKPVPSARVESPSFEAESDAEAENEVTWKHSPSVHPSAAVLAAVGQAPVSSLAGTGANKQLRSLLIDCDRAEEELGLREEDTDMAEDALEEEEYELPDDASLQGGRRMDEEATGGVDAQDDDEEDGGDHNKWDALYREAARAAGSL